MAAVKKKLAKNIMAKGKALITCGPKEKVGDVIKKMVRNKISGLPVVDDDGKVVGVITEADVITTRKTCGVKSAMTDKVITVDAEATAKEVGELLARKKIKRALVLKDDDSLWGVVSRTDVLKALA